MSYKNKKKIVIVGAGAAGLAFSVAVKKLCKSSVDVTLLESYTKIGRKILASGNGRCNLSNSKVTAECYNNSDFLRNHLKDYGFSDVKEFYEDLGLLIAKPDSEGRVYPATFSALSVINCYENAIDNLEIDLKLSSHVAKLEQTTQGYCVILQDTSKIYCDYLILAYGSIAHTGIDNNFNFSKLKIKPSICSLCPVVCKKSELKHLENVRSKATVTLEDGSKNIIHVEKGEVLFKTNRISGIVMFNISSIMASKKIDNAVIHLDLYPDFKHSEIVDMLIKNSKNTTDLMQLFTGICVKGIAKTIIGRIESKYFNKSNWDYNFFNEAASVLKDLTFNIERNNDAKEAQVMSGGVALDCINNQCFECNDYKNLFILGEALDIDGLCGGFNLHFAVSSAISAANEIYNREQINATN